MHRGQGSLTEKPAWYYWLTSYIPAIAGVASGILSMLTAYGWLTLPITSWQNFIFSLGNFTNPVQQFFAFYLPSAMVSCFVALTIYMVDYAFIANFWAKDQYDKVSSALKVVRINLRNPNKYGLPTWYLATMLWLPRTLGLIAASYSTLALFDFVPIIPILASQLGLIRALPDLARFFAGLTGVIATYSITVGVWTFSVGSVINSGWLMPELDKLTMELRDCAASLNRTKGLTPAFTRCCESTPQPTTYPSPPPAQNLRLSSKASC